MSAEPPQAPSCPPRLSPPWEAAGSPGRCSQAVAAEPHVPRVPAQVRPVQGSTRGSGNAPLGSEHREQLHEGEKP